MRSAPARNARAIHPAWQSDRRCACARRSAPLVHRSGRWRDRARQALAGSTARYPAASASAMPGRGSSGRSRPARSSAVQAVCVAQFRLRAGAKEGDHLFERRRGRAALVEERLVLGVVGDQAAGLVHEQGHLAALAGRGGGKRDGRAGPRARRCRAMCRPGDEGRGITRCEVQAAHAVRTVPLAVWRNTRGKALAAGSSSARTMGTQCRSRAKA